MRAALIVALLAAAGCDPYDPSLGDVPFRCGSDEPRCPSGYLPVDVSVVRCECRRAGLVPDAGSGYLCDQDPFESPERNDTLARATPVDEVTLNPSRSFTNLSICPLGDIDYFALSISREGSKIVVRANFDLERSAPKLDIVGKLGQSLNPQLDTSMEGVVTATLTTTASRDYVVKVTADQEVNYGLLITLIPPPSP